MYLPMGQVLFPISDVLLFALSVKKIDYFFYYLRTNILFIYDVPLIWTIGNFHGKSGLVWVETSGVGLYKGLFINFEISIGE